MKKYDVKRVTKDGEIKIYLRGWTAKKIAEKFEVHETTVYRAAIRGTLMLKKYYVEEA